MSPDDDRFLLAVVILTYNEEKNLPDCLDSLSALSSQLHVVDSGSTDDTRNIARDYGANVAQHEFETHARQWEWALHSLPLQTNWILGLDADQRLTPELRDELDELFQRNPEPLRNSNGFYVRRRQIFRGRWIRHGGYYPKYMLKLFRRDQVYFDDLDLVDHHFYVEGNTSTLSGDIIEANQKENDITFWIDKHNGYARRKAREELHRRRTNQKPWAVTPRLFGSPDQRVAYLKRIWYHVPLYVRAVLYYVYRYIFRLGFLDRKEGFIFHTLHGFWYRLLIDIHLDELRQKNEPESSTPQSRS